MGLPQIIQVMNHLGGFQKWVVPKNGWFIRENLIKMDDLGNLGVALF